MRLTRTALRAMALSWLNKRRRVAIRAALAGIAVPAVAVFAAAVAHASADNPTSAVPHDTSAATESDAPVSSIVASPSSGAPITLRDDLGRPITLAAPARHAITAAPHATELVYAAGAGAFLAGRAQGSDYPSDAQAIPSIGTALRPNLEIAMALQPDLLIAWQPVVPDPLANLMQRLEVPVFYSDPRTLAAIPGAIETMGRLFGTEQQARAMARSLQARLETLSSRYSQRPPVRVFIQAGLQPIYTLNDRSIISDAVRLCGGINVFGDVAALAPQLSLESVLAAQPEAVIAGAIDTDEARLTLQTWQQRGLPAAQHGHVYSLNQDALYRPGPRLIDVAEQLCKNLDQVRKSAH